MNIRDYEFWISVLCFSVGDFYGISVNSLLIFDDSSGELLTLALNLMQISDPMSGKNLPGGQKSSILVESHDTKMMLKSSQ